MKCLMTGSSGFMGRFLQGKLRQRGDEVVALTSRDADLTQADALSPWANESFDVIWHLAAYTRAGEFCRKYPGEQWLINQRINETVLDWWRLHQPQAKLVALGSSVSYPKDVPLSEEYYTKGDPGDGFYGYATSKRSLLNGLIALSRQYDLKYMYLIPSTLYGPEYHLDGRTLHFIYDLVRKILRGKHEGVPVTLWGDGHQKRELVYVEDFVDTMLRLLPVFENDILNIGAGHEISIREFADQICKHVGYDASLIQYDPDRFVGAKSKCLSIEKLKRILPDYQQTSLQDGMARTIDWVWEHRDTLFGDVPA